VSRKYVGRLMSCDFDFKFIVFVYLANRRIRTWFCNRRMVMIVSLNNKSLFFRVFTFIFEYEGTHLAVNFNYVSIRT
jgi:hypothetical protein